MNLVCCHIFVDNKELLMLPELNYNWCLEIWQYLKPLSPSLLSNNSSSSASSLSRSVSTESMLFSPPSTNKVKKPISSVPDPWHFGTAVSLTPYYKLLGCQKINLFIFFNVLIKEFKSFKIVKICLIIKVKFLAWKYKKIILQQLFQSAQHFLEKREEPGPGCGSGTLYISVRNLPY